MSGSQGGEAVPQDDIPRYHRLLNHGRIKLSELITEKIELDNINAAWKTATEAMYAQGEAGQAQEAQPQAETNGDTTQDVEFEEVK